MIYYHSSRSTGLALHTLGLLPVGRLQRRWADYRIPPEIWVSLSLKISSLILNFNHMAKYPDLSAYGNTVTSRFMVLLTPEYHRASIAELKVLALRILDDPETAVSERKKIEYIHNIQKMRSTPQFQMYLANLTMKGCNLSLNS